VRGGACARDREGQASREALQCKLGCPRTRRACAGSLVDHAPGLACLDLGSSCYPVRAGSGAASLFGQVVALKVAARLNLLLCCLLPALWCDAQCGRRQGAADAVRCASRIALPCLTAPVLALAAAALLVRLIRPAHPLRAACSQSWHTPTSAPTAADEDACLRVCRGSTCSARQPARC